MNATRRTAHVVAALVCGSLPALAPSTATAAATPPPAARIATVHTYARQAAARRGWVGWQWQALEQVVRPESGWDPCASYGARHDCSYRGSSSCGVPQATPCPARWQGHLWPTWRAQVRWLLDYVQRRYGTPSAALAFRLGHGWY